MFFVIGSLALRGPKIQKMTFFEKMSFLTFLGLETIGKRSGVVESVGQTNSQPKWMDVDHFQVKNTGRFLKLFLVFSFSSIYIPTYGIRAYRSRLAEVAIVTFSFEISLAFLNFYLATCTFYVAERTLHESAGIPGIHNMVFVH